jgi:tRNA(Ile)-lysidine synthetase-like protein
MPLLEAENPRLAENLSRMAMDLREDERALSALARPRQLQVQQLREMLPALRSRALAEYLQRCGVREPEREHILLAESLVFSDNPSAKAHFPGGITICRCYDTLQALDPLPAITETALSCPGAVELPELGLRVVCESAEQLRQQTDDFTVTPDGPIVVRCRKTGDELRTPGGTKRVKKLFIDRKIPASQRAAIPVISDGRGVLGVYSIGPNLDRVGPGVQIRFEKLRSTEEII